ncbi:hypothetical protein ACFSRY_08030 [Pontibacter locisalis]|uniref:Lipocalin-like domain-containing protein n=1 Tax=Pontibacter locisalis TaxID=1719035 RepID=A0ABW5ILF5_9BACT
MKYASLLCLLCLLLLANTCKKETLETELMGTTWLHSYEEDEGEVLVYRPNSYDFPPSRGRTGFELEKGGVLKQYDIAPTDGLEEHIGEWEKVDKDKVQVKIKGNGQPSQNYIIEIVSLKDNILKLKRTSSINLSNN